METAKLLIADDQRDVRHALELLVKNEGFESEAVNSPTAVIEAIRKRAFDLLLLDMNYASDTTSGAEGLELLSRIRGIDRTLPVVLMTAWASVDLAMEAMQNGGCDFVQKPWDNERLIRSIRRQVTEGRAMRQKESELQEAHDIQQRLLPRVGRASGCDIQTFSQSVSAVGGDYFDVLPLTPASTAFCIGDVSGKGLPAALLMSNIQANVRRLARQRASAGYVCRELNRVLNEYAQTDRFTTFVYAVLDSAAGTLRYSNAGHVPPVIIRRDGAIDRLTEGGTVLGTFRGLEYDEAELPFGNGDRLVLVTDGITEAANADDQEFGDDRLVTLLREHRDLGGDDLCALILKRLASFTGRSLQDDATLMIVSADHRGSCN